MELLGQGFTWLDTGTHESLVDATNFVKTVEQHQHRKIACLEEIAYLNGWISKDELMEVYEVMKKNQYGQYLKDVMDGKYITSLEFVENIFRLMNWNRECRYKVLGRVANSDQGLCMLFDLEEAIMFTPKPQECRSSHCAGFALRPILRRP